MTNEIWTLVTEPLWTAARRFGGQAPTLAAALLLLLLGLFMARAARTIAERILSRAKLDDHTAKVGINEVLSRLGMGKSPTFALSFIVYWFILFIFIVSAANAVSMTVVSELLERFVLFLPRLVACLLILFGGLMFARFLGEVIANAAAANNIGGGRQLAGMSYALTVAFAGATALEQLGLRMTLVNSAVQIALASAGLAAALAFGLGGRKVAESWLRESFERRR